MTVQNLGYWIGQANDGSTGRHPTGWTTGQRWSETAGEWMAMYDAKVTELAAMTADRDAWIAEANRRLPAGSGGTPTIVDVTSGFTESNANTGYKQYFQYTLPTTGYWQIHLEYSYDNGAGQADLYTRWQGPDGSFTADTPYVWTSRTGVLVADYALLWGAGGIVRYQARSTNGTPYLARHGCTATFVPTPTYPH